MVKLVTLVINSLVVDIFLDVVYFLVTNVLSGSIVIIDTSVAVVPPSISPPIPGIGGKV